MTDNQFHKPAESEKHTDPAVEPTEHETTDNTEEKSDFLLQWQKRHEAYLAQQQEKTTEKADEHPEKKRPERPVFEDVLAVRQARRQPVDEEQTEPLQPAKQIVKPPIPWIAIWKSVPIFIVAGLILILSIYFISPYSTEKDIIVKGNQQSDVASVIDSSQIANKDYVLTTFLNKASHENNIKNANIWIKNARIDFQFPNHFTITIEEYSRVGYVKQGDNYYAVFSSGEMLTDPTPVGELPESYMTINLTDKDLVKKLVLQLMTVDNSIVSAIQDIQLTPSKVTNDLLTLSMADGNKILVPLSEISVKLPYYAKIAPQLQVASTVDMEVGIFSYASE